MEELKIFAKQFSDYAWGPPLLILLLGGGTFLLIYSRFLPFRYLGHAVAVLQGKYDDPNDPGEINHYEALASALSATVGMGNISGVAVAISTGGPGALFWMWLCAMVGMATKFFTCTLAIMYRGKDSLGNPEGGPMYVVLQGLGKEWKFLAVFFAIVGLLGTFPLFQANQLTQLIRDLILVPNELVSDKNILFTNIITGLGIAILVSFVIFGGIKRIAKVAGKLVPFMVVVYLLSVLFIVLSNIQQVPATFLLIIQDAFQGNFAEPDALLGGGLGAVMMTGIKRAAFSNEAGIGTAPMIHGAAKTKEPIREGLVAMLGPAIDTIIVCTLTALAILMTGVWQSSEQNGITLTVQAFDKAIPYNIGVYALLLCAIVFALSTLFTYSYYGTKCLSFLAGAENKKYYNYIYVVSIIFGAAVSIEVAVNLIDGLYALMAIPTMFSALWLSPKVIKAAKNYFKNIN